MRRVLAALLVVLLPLQWGWAVAAATCLDGGWNDLPAAMTGVDDHPDHHHGHAAAHRHVHADGHAHGSHAGAGAGPADPAAPAAPDTGDGDTGSAVIGCAVCHLPVATVETAVVPRLQPAPEAEPQVGPAVAVPEPPLQQPFRPPALRGA